MNFDINNKIVTANSTEVTSHLCTTNQSLLFCFKDCATMNELLTTILLLFHCSLSYSQNIDVYEFPGLENNILEMTRHPGQTDFEEIAVCLRLSF